MNAYDKALSLLSVREHTAKEIMRKLSDKGLPKDESGWAIARLISQNYLSEERFAESYIRSRLKKTAEGKSLLKMRLCEKGTPSSIADEYLSYAWDEKAYIPSLKKEYNSLCSKKGREKAYAKLLSKGFSVSEIRSVSEEDFEF